jgi:two-component system cell cycle response regulator
MSGRVLVVDDVEFNVKLLDTKLKQLYYNVITASNGKIAVEMAKTESPDIILMDVMMPEMDGFEATSIIKHDPLTSHIPIIMVTALSAQEDKVKGLEVGADDFLTKPINDHALITRLRSLIRIKAMTDEIRMRDQTSQEMGVVQASMERREKIEDANVLIIDDDGTQIKKMRDKLSSKGVNVDSVESLEEALKLTEEKSYHVFIISTLLLADDGLRIYSELKAREKSKHVPCLVIIDESDLKTIDTAMEIGVHDYINSPIETNEFFARVSTQIRRKNYQDELKEHFVSSLTQSMVDALTGLNNRRYFETHGPALVKVAHDTNKPLCLMMFDIDFFKKVNDTYGHPSGDAVIKDFAARIKGNLRMNDLCARFGGEEFVVILVNTPIMFAQMIAERIREATEENQFVIPADPGAITKTCSIGVSQLRPGETVEELLHRADQNLYKAKESGRNKVVIDE